MKKNLLFGICFLLFGISSKAQFADHRKTLEDSEFVVKDVIKIPTVLYDLGKATLRPESMDSLKPVFEFLQRYPYLAVEISNHQDAKSYDPKSDTRLSLRRAQGCMDSLVKMGIDPKRLTAMGYGITKPMVPETMIKKLPKQDQEKAYAINRRTELKIISTNFTK